MKISARRFRQACPRCALILGEHCNACEHIHGSNTNSYTWVSLQVWAGAQALLNFLKSPESADLNGHAVIELGAGLGLVGICAALKGCHVLMTDVSSVAEFIHMNILMNSQPLQNRGVPADSPWHQSKPVGLGTAACMSLDWLQDTQSQANSSGQDLNQADFIIACEVIWLQELLHPYVNTLARLLHSDRRPVCYMSYTNRGTQQSTVFTAESTVQDALKAAGCDITVLQQFASETNDGEQVVFWKVVARQ